MGSIPLDWEAMGLIFVSKINVVNYYLKILIQYFRGFTSDTHLLWSVPDVVYIC